MTKKELYSKIEQLSGNNFSKFRNKINSFLSEGRTEIEVYNIITRYIAIEPYCRTLDFENGDYIDFVKSIKKGTFLKAKFNEEYKIAIMNKTMAYEDDCICIFKPTCFEESNVVGEPSFCFSYSQGRWDEHYKGYNEAIYFVYDVMRELTPQMFVAITVRPLGTALVLDCEHQWFSRSESARFIQGLGNGMNVIKTKYNKSLQLESIKVNNTKNKIRLTEGELHKLIKESVKILLREGNLQGVY